MPIDRDVTTRSRELSRTDHIKQTSSMDDSPSSGSKTHLTWSSIALAFSFIASNVIVSLVLGLQIGGSLVVAAGRCVIQLALLALVLRSVYESNNPWVVAGIACTLPSIMHKWYVKIDETSDATRLAESIGHI